LHGGVHGRFAGLPKAGVDDFKTGFAETARELDQWIERQVQEGRVVRNPLPNP